MKKYLFMTFLVCFDLYASQTDFESHFFINGKKVEGMNHVMVMPGKPVLMEVFFTNPRTGEVYKDFKLMHGKYMHMVAVKKDLSVFKHFHPYFDPVTGRFAMTLNMPYADPDNQDGNETLTEPGMYMLMSDVIVKGVGMRMDHAMIMVMGPGRNTELVPDESRNGVITKYFKRNPEDQEPMYEARFSHRATIGCSGSMVDLEVEMFRNDNGVFVPMLDFEPWLSEAAHAVWMSEGWMNNMMGAMPFAHMHSPFVLDDDDDDTNDRVLDHILRFNFHDQKQMLPGTQKMWVQFKHQGRIMKMPFIFNYRPEEPTGCGA